jgi:hypothetical protein
MAHGDTGSERASRAGPLQVAIVDSPDGPPTSNHKVR